LNIPNEFTLLSIETHATGTSPSMTKRGLYSGYDDSAVSMAVVSSGASGLGFGAPVTALAGAFNETAAKTEFEGGHGHSSALSNSTDSL
jgi:hypothetical protein